MKEQDDLIRQHYARQRIPAEKLDALMQPDQRMQRRTLLGMGLAACVAGLAGGLLARHVSISERTRSTMREAALNHATPFTVEFGNNDIAKLNQRMQLLPFKLELPEKLSMRVDILGARYCTISGNLAVHMKLFDQLSQRSLSLFITPVFDNLMAIDHERQVVEGVDVELWQEKRLFYALAQ